MGMLDEIPGTGKFLNLETGWALWKELEDTAIDRIITSQHDFVRFMQSLHVPDDRVFFPPEGGWPEITKESFSGLDKTDRVIEVLRNMAYIEGPMSSEPCEILLETSLADYREPNVVNDITSGKADRVRFFTEPVNNPAPRDFIGLMIGGSQCRMIQLDCRHGIVRWIDCEEGITKFGLMTKGGPPDSEESDWGGDTAWPVEEFFDYIKKKFTSFEQLSYNRSYLIREDYDMDGLFDVCKEMYQRHGFPGADYNKESCMEEMREHCEEHNI